MKLPPMLGPQVFNLPISVTQKPDTGCVVLNITGKWYEEILRESAHFYVLGYF